MARKGIENLVVPTSEQARRNGSKGGKASAESRKRKKELRELVEIIFEKEMKGKNGDVMTVAEAMVAKQAEKALHGDTRAFEVLRDTAGQKPVEKVMVADVDQSIMDEVESAVSKKAVELNDKK